MKVISLFSGIGGMDMGFGGRVVVHRDSIAEPAFIGKNHSVPGFVELERLDFGIVFQNDILEGAKEVYSLNDTPTNYNTTSIYDLVENDFAFPSGDVVIGGFPCQDFSHCGRRRGFGSTKAHDLVSEVVDAKQNSRGTLYRSFVEVVRKTRPKVFVAENVYGLLTMKEEPIKQIIKDFQDLGYSVEYQVVYCPEFGIPQTRKRVIIMGISTSGRTVPVAAGWNVITKNQTECHIGKYFEHLEEPSDSDDISQQMYSKAKRLSKGQGQTEVKLDGFAPTMRAEHHGNIEFRRHTDGANVAERHLPERRLTVREAGLIQTFPPDYVFTEKKNMRSYKYIGNAVPPLLGYLIADKVAEVIKHYF